MGDAQAPITTIPPFTNQQVLPACATACGQLYNANGACVPPGGPSGAASVYTSCFCSNSEVAPFSTGTVGVCDGACPAGSDGMSSIAAWFQDICSVGSDKGSGDSGNGGNKNDGGDTTTTTATGGSSSGDKSGSSNSGGGDWLSTHWQWVIMLVILVVGIAGIWIGACIWRRRYLKRKDRQSSLGQKQSGSVSHPSWGPGVADGAVSSPEIYAHDSTAQGVFMPGAAAAEEKSKKSGRNKWAPA